MSVDDRTVVFNFLGGKCNLVDKCKIFLDRIFQYDYISCQLKETHQIFKNLSREATNVNVPTN